MSVLPFTPEAVGRHWSRSAQANVVAVNWRTRDVLIGACDWGQAPVEEKTVDNLGEEETARLRRDLPDQGQGWTFHYAIFTRAGMTEAAQAALQSRGGLVVPLSHLERGLGP